ncbi:MAG: hypothetical protein ACRD0K_09665 [Egibacteraceae bacterium]
MSVPATAYTASTTGAACDPQRPYRDCSAVELAEWMEIQYDRDEGFEPAAVFELVVRACELEALKTVFENRGA